MAPIAPKGGGNIITKKYGPLPGWAWAGIAGAAFLVYRQRKAAQAAAAGGSSTTPTDVTAATSPLAQAPTGYGYQGPGVGGGSSSGPGWNLGQATGATGGTTATTGAAPAVAAAATPTWNFQGTGYASSQQSVDGYAGVPTGAAAAALQQAGKPLYYASAPDVFTPVVPGLAPGTELFQKTS